MSVYAISDLHLSNAVNKPMFIFGNVWQNHWSKIKESWNDLVSPTDTVLIAGDVSWAMHLKDAISDLKEIDALNGNKIIIKGNHDYWWVSANKLNSFSNEFPTIKFLKNDAVKINDKIFCGSRGWLLPDSLEFKKTDLKIYKRELLRARLSLEKGLTLQENNEEIIYITHYPPINELYKNNDITALLKEFSVKKVVFGHLHRDKQKYLLENTVDDITFYLTSCDLLGNKLIKIC